MSGKWNGIRDVVKLYKSIIILLTFIVFLLSELPRMASDKSTASLEVALVAAFDVASGLIIFACFFAAFFFFFFFFGGSSAAAV